METNEALRYQEIGARIQSARENAGMTQGQLAKLIGYQTATAISLIESGERKLKVGELDKIGQALHIGIEYLLTGLANREVSVKMALRAEHNDLKESEIKQIESFIDFIKSEQDGRRGNTK